MFAASDPGPLRGRLLAVAAALAALALLAAPAIAWLPQAGEARDLFGALLAAQAAIAALTLAVANFVMEGVRSRRGADSRTEREYFRRSRAERTFGGSIAAVGTTGATMFAAEFGAAGMPLLGELPGLPNVLLLAAGAFAANLFLSWLLFRRAIRAAWPEQWQALRREVDERAVRDAVQAWAGRRRRVLAQPGEDLATALAAWRLDPGEGQADMAIRALLGDARRAMDESREDDFARALDSIRHLVEYAMDEVERRAIGWEAPGARPEWPPLRELPHALYPFREAVIRRGGREHAFAFLNLDYGLLANGVRRRCGELFTASLEGYRHNYEIASSGDNDDFRSLFRGREWLNLRHLLYDVAPGECAPYLTHAVRHQERLLSHALHDGNIEDFQHLRTGFTSVLDTIGRRWNADRWPAPETETRRRLLEAIANGRLPAEPGLPAAELHGELEQLHRIALMGLAGRAVRLAAEGRLADPEPYLAAARSECGDPDRLAGDTAHALALDMRDTFSWGRWEWEGAANGTVRPVDPQWYPLAFFSVRLLELAGGPPPELDLRGKAKDVLGWFTENAGSLERHVRAKPGANGASMESRRERAFAALREAVRRDEAARDEEDARRPLSEDRVSEFASGVYASAFTLNTVERLFARAGAARYVSADAAGEPELHGFKRLVPKGPFTDDPAWIPGTPAQTAREYGAALADDALRQLCAALDTAPAIDAPLGGAADLPRAIEAALASLGAPGEAIVVLAGDWADILVDLDADPPDGYEPGWMLGDRGEGEWARYRERPVLRDRGGGGRRLYVVQPGAWGCFVRAPAEDGCDLLAEVEPIPVERAAEIVGGNPELFADERDEAARLRKARARVEIAVAQRVGFRVRDPARARSVGVPPRAAL